MVYNHFYSVRMGVGKPVRFDMQRFMRAGFRALLPMLTPVILMIGILDGFFTPTEAAAIAVVYTFFIAAFVCRELKWTDLAPMLIQTARVSGGILFIAATAKLAAWVFAYATTCLPWHPIRSCSGNPSVMVNCPVTLHFKVLRITC